MIFPEGTRAEPGAMLPLQPGVAALAARTRLPVIPVVTDFGPLLGTPGIPQATRDDPYPRARADPDRHSGATNSCSVWKRRCEASVCGKLCGLSSRCLGCNCSRAVKPLA